jgi:DNA-binding transcriptional MocR family regulator
MRRLYAEQQRALVFALDSIFGSSVLDVPSGAMHVTGRVHVATMPGWRRACSARDSLRSLCHSARPDSRSIRGLLLSFSNIRTKRAELEVRRLHEAIADHLSEAPANTPGPKNAEMTGTRFKRSSTRRSI